MRINHNIAALNTHRQMSINTAGAGKSIEKLSSGLRINRAGDDAAGLAISEKMRGQIRGLDQSSRNAQDGISLIQTAEGALNETHSILQRMRELAVQSANGTSTNGDKKNIQDEINQLVSEVDRIANDTEFNTKKLLNGDLSQQSKFATFANGTDSAGLANVTTTAVATQGTTNVNLGSGGTAAATASVWMIGSSFSNVSGSALLTNLASGGTNLGLQVGDELTISAVVGGEVKNSVFVVTSTSSLNDLAAAMKNTTGAASATVQTASGVAGTARSTGLDSWGTSGGDYSSGNITVNGQNGAANDISSFSITAKSSDGITRSTFNSAVNTGANGGLKQLQVATNIGDFVARVDQGTAGASAGDSVVAVRSNAVVKASNLTLEFGGTLTGSGTAAVTVASQDSSASIHIGANEGQTTDVSINAMGAVALGLQTNGVNISVMTSQSAEEAITTIETALTSVSSERSKLGAIQNRLEHTINNLGTSSENLTASESRIRDVDMAKEMMEFTKNNILSQAAQAMMAQANQQPQGVLQLLR